MSLVKRRGVGTAVIVLVGAAAVGALVATSGERPVDVRLVAPRPAEQETVSASMTTTVPAVAPVTTTTPRTETVVASAGTPTDAPRPKAPSTTTYGLPDLINGLCEYLYYDSKGKEQCLHWDLTMQDPCKWLAEQGIKKIKVRGRDGRDLDLDLNGFACDQQGNP